MFEIERKFLIPKIPADTSHYPHTEIMQGYFFNEGEQIVRVRKEDDQYFQTIKIGHGLKAEEQEEVISQSIFEELRNNVEDWYLEKTRYKIPYEGKVIEMDIYKGRLEGLVTAEIEFTSEQEAKNFPMPERFGRELTDVLEAENAYLAKYGLPNTIF